MVPHMQYYKQSREEIHPFIGLQHYVEPLLNNPTKMKFSSEKEITPHSVFGTSFTWVWCTDGFSCLNDRSADYQTWEVWTINVRRHCEIRWWVYRLPCEGPNETFQKRTRAAQRPNPCARLGSGGVSDSLGRTEPQPRNMKQWQTLVWLATLSSGLSRIKLDQRSLG